MAVNQRTAVCDLEHYFHVNSIVYAHQWHEAIQKDSYARQIHGELLSRVNYQKMVHQIISGVRLGLPHPCFEDRIKAVKLVSEDEELVQLMKEFCVFQKIDIQEVLQCMMNKLGKRKTVYCVGPANAGKTFFLNWLSSVYEPYEIGRLSPAGIQSEFWLQDLYGKELYVGDEILASQLNIDTLKLLFEGNPNLCTDIKFGEKQPILCKPVLVACNNEITINIPAATDAIHSRCVRISFEPGFPFNNVDYSRRVKKSALKRLYNKV